MRFRRPHGRAEVDPASPRAWATCSRCSMLYNHADLVYDKEWAGAQLQSGQMPVCERCADQPQEQLRTFVLPPDPEPIELPRPGIYLGQDD
jgi:hypothetical protein